MPQIFCPNNHLILDAPCCPVCHWERPAAGQPGKLAWGPIQMNGSLGGPGRGIPSRVAAQAGMVAVALATGELAGISLASGEQKWRFHLEPGRQIRDMLAENQAAINQPRFLAAVCDERDPLEAKFGYLMAVDPATGERETLWTAENFRIGALLVTDELILARTGKPDLVALSRSHPARVIRRQPLRSSGLAGLVKVGERVLVSGGYLMSNEGWLAAYDIDALDEEGRPAWDKKTEGILENAPTLVGDLLLEKNRKGVLARRADSGDVVWSRDIHRAYSPLVVGEVSGVQAARAYIVRRGSEDASAGDHYLLECLDPQTGKTAWTAPLNTRFRQLAFVAPDTLLLGSDQGLLLACSAADGRALWEHALGSEYDPLRTEFLVAGGRLLAGTASGTFAALWTAVPPEAPADPQECLDRGDLPGAAAAFALRGDLARAAEFYAEQIHDAHKAILLYRKAKQASLGGDLALKLEQYDLAMACYEEAGYAQGKARVYQAKGDHLNAAALYEEAGLLREAAQQYAEGDRLEKAVELLFQLGDAAAAVELMKKMTLALQDINELEGMGLKSQAAALAVTAGYYPRAVEIYEALGDKPHMLEILRRLAVEQPERWSLERLAQISRSDGLFYDEAQARQKMSELYFSPDDYLHTAEAYHRAARQAESVMPDKHEAIADLYSKAQHWYDESYLRDKVDQCQEKIDEHRRVPKIAVKGQADREFKEGGSNFLNLQVTNTGYSIAKNIQFSLNADCFDLVKTSSNISLKYIRPKETANVTLYVKTREGVFDIVLLAISWTWQDERGSQYEGQSDTTIKVLSKGEITSSENRRHSAGNTTNIYNGPVINGEGGSVHIGDTETNTVSVNGGVQSSQNSSSAAPTQPQAGEKICPKCDEPMSGDKFFCTKCGSMLN